MTRVRLRNGKEATLEHGVWTSDDSSLEAMLALMVDDYGPGPAYGDPELACSTRIAQRLKAEVIAHKPLPHNHVPGRVYQVVRESRSV